MVGINLKKKETTTLHEERISPSGVVVVVETKGLPGQRSCQVGCNKSVMDLGFPRTVGLRVKPLL